LLTLNDIANAKVVLTHLFASELGSPIGTDPVNNIPNAHNIMDTITCTGGGGGGG